MTKIMKIDEMVQNGGLLNRCFNLPTDEECEMIRRECKSYSFNPQLQHIPTLNKREESSLNLLYDEFYADHQHYHPNEDGYYVKWDDNAKELIIYGLVSEKDYPFLTYKFGN